MHLSGAAIQNHGPGGDGDCGDAGSTVDNELDQTMFILPPAYRPAKALVGETPEGSYIVAGNQPLPIAPPNVPIPAGGVAISSHPGGPGFVEGISFRAGSAAQAGSSTQRGAPRAARKELRIELR